MSKEVLLQLNMFTGELVDNRSRKQKKQDKERAEPQQSMMFSQREMAQFGVEAHPKIPLSPKTRLEMVLVDGRSPEQKEHQLQQEIAAATYALPWAVGGSITEPEGGA